MSDNDKRIRRLRKSWIMSDNDQRIGTLTKSWIMSDNNNNNTRKISIKLKNINPTTDENETSKNTKQEETKDTDLSYQKDMIDNNTVNNNNTIINQYNIFDHKMVDILYFFKSIT